MTLADPFIDSAIALGLGLLVGLQRESKSTRSRSTAKMASMGQLDPGRGWRVILIALASNLAFKTAIVAVLGSRRLLVCVAILFAILGAVAGAVVLLYP